MGAPGQLLAGRGSISASDFRDRVVVSIRDRLEWLLEQAWQQQPLQAEDFDALVGAYRSRVEPGSVGRLP